MEIIYVLLCDSFLLSLSAIDIIYSNVNNKTAQYSILTKCNKKFKNAL